MQCKDNCSSNQYCAKQIFNNQPDFKAQKSLVQEVFESADHLCIFLPKFHCELNFIKYFCEAVKRYLHGNCDYTFAMLQANMPKALASVAGRLGMKDAQFQVQVFSSRKYKSY